MAEQQVQETEGLHPAIQRCISRSKESEVPYTLIEEKVHGTTVIVTPHDELEITSQREVYIYFINYDSRMVDRARYVERSNMWISKAIGALDRSNGNRFQITVEDFPYI